jgi:glycerol-3-phosphate dehydrogenase
MKNHDVAIIGGGVIGSAIAFELSKYTVDVAVIEKESDVASGASKANSGVVHSGINSPPDSLKARFCVEGNQKIKMLAEDLGFSYKNVGKYIIAKNNDEIQELEKLKKIGIKNNVSGLEIHDKSIVNKKEPNVLCHSGLWVPTAGIILPYEFTISLAENAAINDVDFLLETEVKDVEKKEDHFFIKTNNDIIRSELLINAAGINCRKIVSMLEEPDFNVYPCRGEYLILDKKYSPIITSMIYPIPVRKLGVLGVHITPTVEGNILLGPSAEFINDLDDKRTTAEKMEILYKEAKEIIPSLPEDSVINAYSGIRCKLASEEECGLADYRIFESKETPGLINLLGIESPGLTAAPAIAEEIRKMIDKKIVLKEKENFTLQKRQKRFSEMSLDEKAKLIQKDETWGRIVCRCEQITEAEVINALSNPLGAKTLSAVKYRCRAGMGRCQGGFCTQHIVRILEDTFNVDFKKITLKSPNSNLFYRRNREVINDK